MQSLDTMKRNLTKASAFVDKIMSQQVFILFENSGEYEDHQRIVHGVFESLEEAVSTLLVKASENGSFEYKPYNIVCRFLGDSTPEDGWLYVLIPSSQTKSNVPKGFRLVCVLNELRTPVCAATSWRQFKSKYAGQERCRLCESHNLAFDDEFDSLTEFNKKWAERNK